MQWVESRAFERSAEHAGTAKAQEPLQFGNQVRGGQGLHIDLHVVTVRIPSRAPDTWQLSYGVNLQTAELTSFTLKSVRSTTQQVSTQKYHSKFLNDYAWQLSSAS